MSKLVKRLLIFFVGFPLVLGCIILPFPNNAYLLVNLLIIGASALGALETGNLFLKKGAPLHPFATAILGTLFPLFTYLELIAVIPPGIMQIALLFAASAIFFSQVIGKKEKDFEPVLSRIGGYLTTLFYPGIFMSFATRMSIGHFGGHFFDIAPYPLLFFVLMTYGNDSLAWLVGMLFGRNSRGMVAVSPNKSLAGFAGGLLASSASGLLVFFVIPELPLTKLPLIILWGLSVGFATILGDLVESAMKRSAGVKDSGDIIPGRGGLLDSIDSLLFAAPVFYYFFTWII